MSLKIAKQERQQQRSLAAVADFELHRWLDAELKARGRGAAARLAGKSGLTPSVITKLRKGESKGSWDTLSALARGFDMTRGQLVAAVDGQPLPDAPGLNRTEAAIRSDPLLMMAEQEYLIAGYWNAIGRGRLPLPPRRSAGTK